MDEVRTLSTQMKRLCTGKGRADDHFQQYTDGWSRLSISVWMSTRTVFTLSQDKESGEAIAGDARKLSKDTPD